MPWLVMAAFWLAVVGSVSAEQIDSISDPFLIEQLSSPPATEYVPNEIIIKFREETATNIEKALSEGKGVKDAKFTDSLSKLNNKYKLKHAGPIFRDFKKHRQQLQTLQNKNKSFLTKQDKHILRRLKRAPKNARVPDLDRIYKLELDLDGDQSLEEVVSAYRSDPDVEYAELNYIASIDSVPNDPLFPLQWALDNQRQIYPESGDYTSPPGTMDSDIDAPEAWDIHTDSSDVVVAVIDTGVDYEHRDLDDNMWTDASGNYGYNFIKSNYDPMDDHGHGTHCAGIIAAEGDNGIDISGVCWNAKIMAIKAFDHRGSGNTATSALAIRFATDQGADIISNSWGQRSDSDVLRDAIDYARSQGVLLVASAGNRNREEFQYPAAYENVISVAATDSHDHKNPLSNHAGWIDIAAPGVDILSLRAQGISMGTIYDDYTTVESGTSMACPHVSGTLALMLSYYPLNSIEWITNKLLLTADNISDENPYYVGRLGTGRVNAYKALRDGFEGNISLNRNIYSCNDKIIIQVFDFDLIENLTQQIILETDAGDEETVTLIQDANSPWIFKGRITTSPNPIIIGDGIMQVSHGQAIIAAYYDENNGTGLAIRQEVTAMVDCQPPAIFNVEVINIHSTGAEISFETDEPATAFVHGGTVCSGPYTNTGESLDISTKHKVYLPGLTSETDYRFIVGAVDAVGNKTTDSNDGNCYSFTTTISPEGIKVPGGYTTIQAAIDAAQDGDTIWVAGGTYTGEGNRDINFAGKRITLKSECGPKYCIIDCQGTEEDPHRGFYFHSGEDANSVLQGMTIMNGFGSRVLLDTGVVLLGGGGILCCESGPKIENCIISGNVGEYGGGMNNYGGRPVIIHSTFANNTADREGGGFYDSRYFLSHSSGTFINCIFRDNVANSGGGGIANSSGIFINCIIKGNTTAASWDGHGGGIKCWSNNPMIINCTITDNWANKNGGGIYGGNGSRPTVTQCTISNNCAGGYGGAVYAIESHPEVISSILYNNTSWRGSEIALTGYSGWYSIATISHSNIRSGESGVYVSDYSTLNWGKGNIDADPYFTDPNNGDYTLLANSPCIDGAAPYYYLYGQHFADIDGECRLAGAAVDMGSDEFDSSPDSDADLLSDADETIYGSRINDPDSDGDGLLDGIEVLRGTDPTLTDSPSGISIPSDYRSIQQGLFLAFSDEPVIVSPGTYYENINFQGKDVVLRSRDSFDSNIVANTVIDANGIGNVITFHGNENLTCIVSGLTITNGALHGIDGNGCRATIKNNIISNNSSYYTYAGANGGGVYKCDGLIQNNTISGNWAQISGGGIAYCKGLIAGNNIWSNSSRMGGAISCWTGIIHGNVIRDNIGELGGGVYCYNNAFLSNCIIENNTAHEGGGVYCDGDDPTTITNCLIVGNRAYVNGGGINSKTGPLIKNCTVSGNVAYSYGGAICCVSRARPAVTNSIFYDNMADLGKEIASIYPDKWNPPSIDVSYSNVEGGQEAIYFEEGFTVNWGKGNIDADPSFRNPGYWEADTWIEGDYHLLPRSACIDAGDPEYLPEPDQTDIDGQPRIIGNRIDMGADEFINTPPIANAGEDQGVFAWIDGIAEVKLDGSGSFDVDGDPLDYFWYTDGEKIATSVDPNIELPIGEHTIELIVRDGTEDFEPDAVIVTVIGPIEVDVHIVPRVINRRDGLKMVIAIIRLPEGVSRHDVADDLFVLYAGNSDSDGIEATRQWVIGWGRRASVFTLFDKAELLDAVLNNGKVGLTVVGRLESGRYIHSSDTARIINRRQLRRRRRFRPD